MRLNLERVAVSALVGGGGRERFASLRTGAYALESDVASGLPCVEVDRERIGHVFDNLIGNALRHTPRGGHVRVSGCSDGGAVRLTVEDTGEGDSPNICRICSRNSCTARHAGGAGLGLAIAREVVVAHGGRFDVTSKPGAGSTFQFTLPTVRKSEAQS